MNQLCSLLSRSCACILLLLTFTACSKSTTDTPADPDAAITDPDATTGSQDGTNGGQDATDPGVKSGLTLSDPNVRGCEILLSEGTAKIDTVTFDGTVVGTFIREAPKVAISFVAAKDAPLANGAIQVTVSGDAKQVTVKKVSCVDVKAAAVAGVTATMN